MTKGYHHLTWEIRTQIYRLKKTEILTNKIAKIVARNKSTISSQWTWNRKEAQSASEFQGGRMKTSCKSQLKKLQAKIIEMIEEKIFKKWSPKKISAWLKLEENSMSRSVSESLSPRSIGSLYIRRSKRRQPFQARKFDGRFFIPISSFSRPMRRFFFNLHHAFFQHHSYFPVLNSAR